MRSLATFAPMLVLEPFTDSSTDKPRPHRGVSPKHDWTCRLDSKCVSSRTRKPRRSSVSSPSTTIREQQTSVHTHPKALRSNTKDSNYRPTRKALRQSSHHKIPQTGDVDASNYEKNYDPNDELDRGHSWQDPNSQLID